MGIRCPKCQLENTSDSKFCKECGTQLHLGEEVVFSKTITLETPFRVQDKGSIFAGKYKIIGEIGRGGMGIVLKAEDTKLKRTVALKLLPPELSRYPEAKERFIRESQAAAALDHPHICTIHEAEEYEGQAYIAMAHVEGQSLKERIAKSPLATEEAVEIAAQVAEGLAEAHKKGIIHRDIKPGNIMVTEKGQVKIMDFGLAKVSGESLITKEARTMGTVAYMSPEQAKGETVDHRSDIWSLGVVMYELLSGRLPFGGEKEASILYSIVHEEPKPLKKTKRGLPLELMQIISRALRKNPESRYQTAAEMSEDLRKYQEMLRAAEAGIFNLRSLLRRLRRPIVAIPTALAFIAIASFAVLFFNHQAKIRWAKDTALPEIKRLIDYGEANYGEAYTLALKAEKYIPKDPLLIESLSRCGMKISVETEPSGARIFMKEYKALESDWSYLGVSPVEDVRVPFGFFRWKFEKEGYEPVLAVHSTFEWEMDKPSLIGPARIFRVLDKEGTIPLGMVKVSGDAGDFFMDEHEVTNREFKEFVDRGGYQKKEYWKYPFVKEGKPLTWEEGMAEFRDATGMPGPSTWEGGNYPEGKDDFPVSGVSWYEAASYAEFAGKSLPTVNQWEMGAGLNIPTIFAGGYFLPLVASLSEFGGEGPVSVKARQGITTSGAYDMAGNVREWCRDETEKGRCLRGGAWSDATYMLHSLTQSPPFDRSPRNGFRCVLGFDPEKIPETAYQPIKYQEMRNFYEEKPVPDAIFQVYKDQFSYDDIELKARLDARDESREDWIKEKVSFNAAYENERMSIYLFFPKNAPFPYQTVIVFPGSQAVILNSSDQFEKSEYFKAFIEFMIRSGRALVYPIYKGTYERGNSAIYLPIHLGNGTRQYSDFLIKMVKDFRRTIDYLETRDDIDIHKLAYYGFSWGAIFGAIIPAVEERLEVSVLWSGGFPSLMSRPEKARPEVDEINYVTRVRIPTLMLNGMYDYHAFPLETSARPMFDLLGTPKEDKRQIIYDSDHMLPKSEFIRDTLAWLDKYLGPVNRQ